MKDIKIIVATHKFYQMPTDSMYIPIHVGAEGKQPIGYQSDNVGDNISYKNNAYCELTGLFWAWKNLDADYIGLSHYRRHFKGNKKQKSSFQSILTKNEASLLLNDVDILVTKKRNYYIESIYSHYEHTLCVETLDKTREIIEGKYPLYLYDFDKCMKKTHMHAFNMFIMKKELLDEYCTWLFAILSELEIEMENHEYDAFHARYPGRISELLLDVWLNYHGYKYKEVPFIYMEKINILRKITSFLSAKFFGKKYDGSF